MTSPPRQIARITLAADARFLRAACLFMRDMALAVGLSEKAAANLELATEEAGLLIINQSFAGIAHGQFDIVAEHESGRFVAAFEDKGLPFEWGKAGEAEATRHSVALLSGFADELRFINRGKEGKRLEFVVHQSSPWLETSFQDSGDEGDAPMAPLDTALDLRPLDPETDGVAFARCMYSVYGYSYLETVYFPERVKGLIEKGLLRSYVAVTPEGEVVGHQGLKKEHASQRVANNCMGAVDPRFRGRRLFEALKDFAYADARRSGLVGLYGEVVTLHPYSQRANIAIGGRETGVLLAYVPQGFTFRNIKDGDKAGLSRQTTVLFYKALADAEPRMAYLPARHRAMIEKIYGWLGLERSCPHVGAEVLAGLPEQSRIEVDVASAFGMAAISVVAPGRDLTRRVHEQIEELKLSRVDVIHLDLPLAHPATQELVPQLEALGLFFSGIYPEKHDEGDLLRLQYLNNLRVDPTVIVTASERGKELLDYVLAEMKA